MVLTANKAFGYSIVGGALLTACAYSGARNYTDARFQVATDPVNTYVRAVAGNQLLDKQAGELVRINSETLNSSLNEAKGLVDKLQGEVDKLSDQTVAAKQTKKDLLNQKLKEAGLDVQIAE